VRRSLQAGTSGKSDSQEDTAHDSETEEYSSCLSLLDNKGLSLVAYSGYGKWAESRRSCYHGAGYIAGVGDFLLIPSGEAHQAGRAIIGTKRGAGESEALMCVRPVR